MGVCNQVTFLILNYITSRLVPLLKVIDALHITLMLWILLLASSSSILALKYSFFFFLKCLLTSRLTLFKLSTLLWHGSCTHCIFARFLLSKKPKHSSSNQGLCCFHLCIPRLSFAEIWLLCLMFPQILFTSSSSFKFSKAANLFVISTWYFIWQKVLHIW